MKTVVEVEEWMLSLWLMDVGEAESLPLLNKEFAKSFEAQAVGHYHGASWGKV